MQVDLLYAYLIIVSVAFTIPIVVAIFYFGIRYREKEKYATPDEMHGSIALETVWSIIPFVISMTIFLAGAYVYYNQYRIPDDPGLEVYVVNDANASALAELTFGVAHSSDFLMVRVDQGVGVGLVLDGALYRGSRSASGEIGHVVVDPEGTLCTCGKRAKISSILAVLYAN